MNTSSLTGKGLIGIRELWTSPSTESCTCQRQMCCLCSFLEFFFWFKASHFGRDGKHERTVFAFTWCHLAGFLGIDVSQRYVLLESGAADMWSSGLKPKFPVFKFWIIGYTAFWKMNFFLKAFLNVWDYNYAISPILTRAICFFQEKNHFSKVPFEIAAVTFLII